MVVIYPPKAINADRNSLIQVFKDQIKLSQSIVTQAFAIATIAPNTVERERYGL